MGLKTVDTLATTALTAHTVRLLVGRISLFALTEEAAFQIAKRADRLAYFLSLISAMISFSQCYEDFEKGQQDGATAIKLVEGFASLSIFVGAILSYEAVSSLIAETAVAIWVPGLGQALIIGGTIVTGILFFKQVMFKYLWNKFSAPTLVAVNSSWEEFENKKDHLYGFYRSRSFNKKSAIAIENIEKLIGDGPDEDFMKLFYYANPAAHPQIFTYKYYQKYYGESVMWGHLNWHAVIPLYSNGFDEKLIEKFIKMPNDTCQIKDIIDFYNKVSEPGYGKVISISGIKYEKIACLLRAGLFVPFKEKPESEIFADEHFSLKTSEYGIYEQN